MSILIITVGLPGSGKSSWAYAQRFKVHGDSTRTTTVVIERDEVRAELNPALGRKNFTQEGEVTRTQEDRVRIALADGYNVIVSDTNLAPKAQKRWRNIASSAGAAFEVKSFLDIPIEEVLRRDAGRPPEERVGEKVIMEKAVKYGLVKAEPAFAQIVLDPDLPHAVICDLDGTAAVMGDRSPYEHGKYDLDTPNVIVRHVLVALSAQGGRFIYCSGRKQAARKETNAWLIRYGFPDGPLLMRADDDNRKDSIVKYEILRDEISPRYFPVLVLDDRNQVVEMWRSQGIPTFQVADGNF